MEDHGASTEKVRPQRTRRRRSTAIHKCPRCNSLWVKRSHRKYWERVLLRILQARAYRCSDCHRRFWTSDGGRVAIFVLGALSTVLIVLLFVVTAMAYQSQRRYASRVGGASPIPAAAPGGASGGVAAPHFYQAVPLPENIRQQFEMQTPVTPAK